MVITDNSHTFCNADKQEKNQINNKKQTILFFFQMELVIQLEHFRILLCTEHYHQNRYHTTTFVHLQTVQTVKIDATMLIFINVILKYDNCILMVFDFRASQIIALSVCFHAIQFPHVISSIFSSSCVISV